MNGISKETREKMASKLRGRPLPDWQRKILSNAAKGKDVYWSRKKVYQYTIEGEFVMEYESINDCARILCLQQSLIIKVLKGLRNHTGGFIFKYNMCEVKGKVKSELGGIYKRKEVFNTQTGVIYGSVFEAADKENISYNRLKKMLVGCIKNKTHLTYAKLQ